MSRSEVSTAGIRCVAAMLELQQPGCHRIFSQVVQSLVLYVLPQDRYLKPARPGAAWLAGHPLGRAGSPPQGIAHSVRRRRAVGLPGAVASPACASAVMSRYRIIAVNLGEVLLGSYRCLSAAIVS